MQSVPAQLPARRAYSLEGGPDFNFPQWVILVFRQKRKSGMMEKSAGYQVNSPGSAEGPGGLHKLSATQIEKEIMV